MDFDIQPDPALTNSPYAISLPEKVRRELGLLLGQFLQLGAREEKVVLQVIGQRQQTQEAALVSPKIFQRLQGSNLEYQILEVTLGCDPEFFILWNGRRMSAATYLPFVGEIGCDGELGELRPMYGTHEEHVVSNLRHLIPQIPRRLERSTWAQGFPEDGRLFSYEAYSYYRGVAAGFHVHLGIPPEILNTRRDFNRAALNHIVQCLDWYVSVPLVPLETAPERRTGRSNYGKPGDYRTSNVTLEYRTPGAFYLRSPALARGLLGLSLLLVENIVSRMKLASKNFLGLPKLTPNELHEIMPKPTPGRIQRVLLDPDPQVAQAEIPAIQEQIQKLSSFGKHQEAVLGLFRAVEEKECPSPDLLRNWKEKP